jgi:hypothetical protein
VHTVTRKPLCFRTATARGKAEQADVSAWHAREDAKAAVGCAKQYSADLDIPSVRKNDERAAKEAEGETGIAEDERSRTSDLESASCEWIMQTLVMNSRFFKRYTAKEKLLSSILYHSSK